MSLMPSYNASSNLLDLYLHSCGESEVPIEYHLWSAIALIAAAVSDRVWVEKHKGKHLSPNLYVALIGPSGNGKGEAIDTAIRLVEDHPKIALYNGKATPQFLMNYMLRKTTLDNGDQVDCSKVWLVTPELSMALGKGEMADAFIKHVTEMYTGRSTPILEGTLSRGLHSLRGYCINWISGSTLDWLLETIPPSSISGGFFGRCVGIYQGYTDRRLEMPLYPPDYDVVLAWLHARLTELVEIDGEFTFTPAARDRRLEWYTERPRPSDDSLMPAFKRQQDLVFKLSMIFSLADGLSLFITRKHVDQAIKLSDSVLKKLAEIQAAAATTPATRGIAFAQQFLRGMKRPVMRTEIMRRFYAKGLGGTTELEMALKTLEDGGVISQRAMGRGRGYLYVGRRRLPADDNGTRPTAEPHQ